MKAKKKFKDEKKGCGRKVLLYGETYWECGKIFVNGKTYYCSECRNK